MKRSAPDMDDGWLGNAARLESPNHDARPPGTAIDLVVIHAISLPPGEFGGSYISQFFTNRLDFGAHAYFREIEGTRVSAHFLIDRDGALTQFVRVWDRAWHAGASKWEGRDACNDFSIGIELEGSDEVPFTDPQYGALDGLIESLVKHVPDITRERIVGHCHVAPGRKTDPGPCFDWTRVRTSLPA